MKVSLIKTFGFLNSLALKQYLYENSKSKVNKINNYKLIKDKMICELLDPETLDVEIIELSIQEIINSFKFNGYKFKKIMKFLNTGELAFWIKEKQDLPLEYDVYINEYQLKFDQVIIKYDITYGETMEEEIKINLSELEELLEKWIKKG
ncbi:MAG: hypothetical protein ACRCW9_06235 [Cetobacterium sp.]